MARVPDATGALTPSAGGEGFARLDFDRPACLFYPRVIARDGQILPAKVAPTCK